MKVPVSAALVYIEAGALLAHPCSPVLAIGQEGAKRLMVLSGTGIPCRCEDQQVQK
jgi:hypothetical protein